MYSMATRNGALYASDFMAQKGGISFCQNCEADGKRVQVFGYLETTFET
jgi:hypothetical protein